MQLADKVAIVTGAARGLGRAYCEAMAQEGAAIVAADIASCEDTVTSIAAAGGRAIAVHLDVADAESCEAMATSAIDAFGRIDVLVNNAALYAGLRGARFEHLEEAQWDKVMQVNIKGTWLASRAVVEHMRAGGGGSIINISSLAAVFGLPYGLDYVASKAAVIGMTRGMARELGADLPLVAMSVALGDQLTNLIQPIVIVPVLAIAGLHIRQVMGYMIMALAWCGTLFLAALLVIIYL